MAKVAKQRERDDDHRVPARYEEERDYDDRGYDANYDLDMAYQSATYFSPETIPAGMKYTYIRAGINGGPDDVNWRKAVAAGWKPVPVSRHPEKKVIDPLGRSSNTNEYITYGDTVCCERTIRECRREADYFRNKNARAVEGVEQYAVNSLGVPSRSEDRRGVRRGGDPDKVRDW